MAQGVSASKLVLGMLMRRGISQADACRDAPVRACLCQYRRHGSAFQRSVRVEMLEGQADQKQGSATGLGKEASGITNSSPSQALSSTTISASARPTATTSTSFAHGL